LRRGECDHMRHGETLLALASASVTAVAHLRKNRRIEGSPGAGPGLPRPAQTPTELTVGLPAHLARAQRPSVRGCRRFGGWRNTRGPPFRAGPFASLALTWLGGLVDAGLSFEVEGVTALDQAPLGGVVLLHDRVLGAVGVGLAVEVHLPAERERELQVGGPHRVHEVDPGEAAFQLRRPLQDVDGEVAGDVAGAHAEVAGVEA